MLSKPAKASEGQQWPVLLAGASPDWQVCPRHTAPTLNLAMRLCCQQIYWCSHGFQEGKQMVSWIGQEEFNSLGRDGVSALDNIFCQWQHLCSLFPDPGDQFWPPSKETKKGKAEKRGSSTCWIFLCWEEAMKTSPRVPCRCWDTHPRGTKYLQ